VVLAGPAAAQSNVEVNAGVQFDFLSPGARSLAMGGAFIGNADDATAAFVNPAGLRALTRREVSFEGRGRDFSIPIIRSGRLNGSPSTQGVDTVGTLDEFDSPQSAGGLSYVSFVYPQARWAIAGYRHELANFDIDVQTNGAFFNVAPTQQNPSGQLRRFPISGSMDLSIVNYGISGSFNVTQQLSVGGGISFYDFSMDSTTNRFDINNTPRLNLPPDPENGDPLPVVGNPNWPSFTDPPFFGGANFSADNIVNTQTQIGEQVSAGVNLGVLWAPDRRFQLGAVYRQGPDFDISILSAPGPSVNRRTTFTPSDDSGQFHVPHVFGVGAVVRPIANGTFAIDIARVQHSRLTDDFVALFGEDPEDYSVNDATEVHLGFEYVIPRRIPIAVRGGYWLDPEHALAFNGQGPSDALQRQVFRQREDEHHVTFGAGAVFGRFEINGAGDLSDRATTVSFSAVVRF
jgi:long-subunit fatty acid transport protein